MVDGEVIKEIAFHQTPFVFARLLIDDRNHRVAPFLHLLQGLTDREIVEKEVHLVFRDQHKQNVHENYCNELRQECNFRMAILFHRFAFLINKRFKKTETAL